MLGPSQVDSLSFHLVQKIGPVKRDAAFARLRESGIGDEQLRFVHYTSAEAALQIIRQKRLWMRNTTCMADYREVRHGYDILNKVFFGTTAARTFVSAVDSFAQGAAQEAFSLFEGWWKQKQIRHLRHFNFGT